MLNASESRFSKISRDIDTKTVEVSDSILIVCEGEKTEPNYFKKFPVSNLKVEVDGLGSNTIDLVKYAILKKKQQEYDSIWCVFDKDSFPDSNFNEACDLAERSGIELAYSVESFELWYLLHFEYLNTGIHRKQYIEKLNKIFTKKFNQNYTKNSEAIYRLLSKENQQSAIKNAKKLAEQYNEANPPANRYPVTYVYKLVEKLNRYLQEKRWETYIEDESKSHKSNSIKMISSAKIDSKVCEIYEQRITVATSKKEIDEIVEEFFVSNFN